MDNVAWCTFQAFKNAMSILYVGVYFSESGLQNFASPMIWKYIPNMDMKEIGKALFWFSYENIDPMY